ncbi:glycosyltransferase [Marinoscillum sp.]|uniref:glycosyltransferase n=1 Tax=Marinoscillum sp. TaxID=2024838 RepID=UPI003BAB6D66
MRILHLHSEKNWGGGEKQLLQLVLGLKEHGVEQLLICPKGSMLERQCDQEKINKSPLRIDSGISLITCYHFIKLINQYQPDLIHLHTSKAHTLAIVASVFSRMPPLVLTRRMNNRVSGNWFSRHKYNHPAIQKIICVSDRVKTTLSLAIPKEKLQSIYGGISIADTEMKIDQNFLTDKYPHLNSKKVIGFVGRLTEVKDPLLFMEMVKTLHKSMDDLSFVIIGNGPLVDVLENEIRKYELEGAVTLVGFTSDSISAISSLDLLVLTSRNEGIPNVILEAFVCQVPVLAVNVGGIPELIKDEKSGLLVNRSPQDLAVGAERLLQDADLRERVINGGKKRAQQLDANKGIEATLELYNRIIGANS